MEQEQNKGVLWNIMNNSAGIEYDPTKPICVEDMFKELVNAQDREREWKRKTGWKEEYILTNQEARELPLHILNWLGEKYRVLCSLEAKQIIEAREKESPQPNSSKDPQ